MKASRLGRRGDIRGEGREHPQLPASWFWIGLREILNCSVFLLNCILTMFMKEASALHSKSMEGKRKLAL